MSQSVGIDKSLLLLLPFLLAGFFRDLTQYLSHFNDRLVFFSHFFSSFSRIYYLLILNQLWCWRVFHDVSQTIKRSLTATNTDLFGYGTVYMIKVTFFTNNSSWFLISWYLSYWLCNDILTSISPVLTLNRLWLSALGAFGFRLSAFSWLEAFLNADWFEPSEYRHWPWSEIISSPSTRTKKITKG